jgi:hypothetical protein
MTSRDRMPAADLRALFHTFCWSRGLSETEGMLGAVEMVTAEEPPRRVLVPVVAVQSFRDEALASVFKLNHCGIEAVKEKAALVERAHRLWKAMEANSITGC